MLGLDTLEAIQRMRKQVERDLKAAKTMINHEDSWLSICSEDDVGEKECYPDG